MDSINNNCAANGEQAPGRLGSSRRRAPLKRPGLALSLILSGFVLAVSAARWGYYKRQQAVFEQAAENELSAVADLKVSQISRWRQERLDDANLVFDDEIVDSTARDFLAHPANTDARARLSEWMAAFQRHSHFTRILLLDPNLNVRLAIPEKEASVGAHAAELAKAAMQTNSVLVSDLHFSQVSGRIHLDYFVPLFLPGAQPAPLAPARGVFLVSVDPSEFLFPSIQSWPTPSPTAETLLVRREGDEVVYLNQLRHRADTALKLRFSLSRSSDLPAAKAVQGQVGIVHGLDYRKQPVLAALRPIPGSPWFLIAKRDEAEIHGPLRKQAWLINLMAAAFLLAGALGLFLVWRDREYRFSLREIEEHKRLEEMLRQSAERFRGFTAAAFEGICLSEHGRILDINEQFGALFGYTRAELIGREIVTLVAPESRATVAEALGTGREAAYEHRGLRKDGSAFDGEARAKMTLWEGRTVRVSALRDVTERRRAQQELARKNKELESLIYVSSHDLRSPLVNIQGFSHRLQSACNEIQQLFAAADLPPKLQDAVAPILNDRITPSLNFIQGSVQRMDGLLAGLLRLSRLGRDAVRPATLDMQRLAESTIQSLAFQIQQAGARVELGPLAPCWSDGIQISQVLTNLIDNALKYQDPDRPTVVRVGCEPRGSEVVYCVEDNGVGIPAEQQEKIWEVFQRLNPSGSVKGEGLGLAIVRRILDRLGGRAWVESEAGRGSRFFVALPASQPAADSTQAAT